MPIFSDWSCGQTINKSSSHLSKNLLEADRGHMVTFIDYHHTVILDKRLYFAII